MVAGESDIIICCIASDLETCTVVNDCSFRKPELILPIDSHKFTIIDERLLDSAVVGMYMTARSHAPLGVKGDITWVTIVIPIDNIAVIVDSQT